MKKQWKYITPILCFILVIIFILFKNTNPGPQIEKTPVPSSIPTQQEEDKYQTLKKNYTNPDIVGFIEIPDLLLEPVVQTSDNDFYLNHNIDKKKDINGAIFLDYRINIDDSNKIIIYGHSNPELTLPFAKLANYSNKSFFDKHPNIYLYTENKTYIFSIFSSYIETHDFDYLNIKSFNGLSWLAHLQKLKNKSNYETNVEVTEDKTVIILQTCSFNENYQNETQKYHLVMGIEK